jgi:hypothetical protein
MTRMRLAFVVALLAVALLGGFGATAQAYIDPWCMEEYWDCVEAGVDLSDCLCYRYMCMGQMCP